MTQNQYSFIHKSGNITNKKRPKLKEETSTANPEPQRQLQTNGDTTQQEDPQINETD